MMLPPVSLFGDRLRITEVFIDYDGPQLFSCVGTARQSYLAVHAPSDERGDNWLYIAISKSRLGKFTRGAISVREVFAHPEGGLVRVVSFREGKAAVETVSAKDLPDGFLPDDDTVAPTHEMIFSDLVRSNRSEEIPEFVRAPTPMWELSPEALQFFKSIRTPVDVAATRTGRLVADILLRPDSKRTDVSLPALGALLAYTQKLVDSLAYPSAPTKGPLKGAMQQHTRLDAVASFPSSFGLRIESHEATILDETETKAAFARLAALVDAGSDADELKKVIPQIGKRGLLYYRAFTKALHKSEASFEIQVGIPGAGEPTTSSLSRTQIRDLQSLLDAESKQTEEMVEFVGRLVAASLKTKFFLLENDEESIGGRISDTCMTKMSGKELDRTYVTTLLMITEVDETTGEIGHKYVLTDIADE